MDYTSEEISEGKCGDLDGKQQVDDDGETATKEEKSSKSLNDDPYKKIKNLEKKMKKLEAKLAAKNKRKVEIEEEEEDEQGEETEKKPKSKKKGK